MRATSKRAATVGRRAELLSQEDAAEEMGVDVRTLRNWAHVGLPTHPDASGRPQYDRQELHVWSQWYRWLCARGSEPKRLTLAFAQQLHLLDQARQWPERYVAVPLEPDHPMRDLALRRAAAGAPPGDETNGPAPLSWAVPLPAEWEASREQAGLRAQGYPSEPYHMLRPR